MTATAGTKTSTPVTIMRRDAATGADGHAAGTAGDGHRRRRPALDVHRHRRGHGDANDAGRSRFRWNFGDDSEATTNGNTMSHVYTTPLVRRVVTVEVTLSNGQTISAVTEIIVAAF